MPTFSFLGLPSIFNNSLYASSSCSPAADTAGVVAHDRLAMPGAFTNATEEPLPTSSTEPILPAAPGESVAENGAVGISLRELIEDAAGEAIRENNTALQHNFTELVNSRLETLCTRIDARMEQLPRDMSAGLKGSFGDMIQNALNESKEALHSSQAQYLLNTQAQNMKARIRNEINNETLRCKDANAELAVAFETVLKRVSFLEIEHHKMKSQNDAATVQRAKDAGSLASLKAELGRANEIIASLSVAAARRDSMFNTMKLDIAESLRRAEAAERKANNLDVHVKRWLTEELSRKREAEAIERKKREAEERRKREEAARLEEERRKAAAEAYERWRQAQAKAAAEAEERRRQAKAEEAEAARLKEEAKKAEDDARKRAQEQSQREANAERARRKEEHARREKEQDDWARRERERQERKKGDQDILARWALYEAPLADHLTFETIVWPVLIPPVDISDLTLEAIRDFLFSKAHSDGKDNKQRLWDAFKRWHSDKCAAVKSRVADEDKPLIDQAFNDISVHLNDLNVFVKSESATAQNV